MSEQLKEWRKIEKNLEVNDETLGPWESAGVDDNVISEFLERRFLKENDAIIVFQAFFSFTMFVAVIELLMLSDDIALTVVVAMITAGLNYLTISNITNRKERKLILERKQYQVCECTAFDIVDNRDKKYCYVQDASGNVLMERETGKDPVPKKITFHCYFSGKDYSGKILRLKNGRKGMYYIMFPTLYLKSEIGRGVGL